MKEKILIIDEDRSIVRVLSALLKRKHFNVVSRSSGAEALRTIGNERPDCIITELALPDMKGLDLIREVRKTTPDTPVIVLSGMEKARAVVEAMKLGVSDYRTKPFDNEELLLVVRKALEERELRNTVQSLQDRIDRLKQVENIIGSSGPMNKVFKNIEAIAPYDVSILLLGETGTGKELIAKAIHLNSSRHKNNFVAIDCATLPETLVESEVFGFQKGAFTGAVDTKVGKFEHANGGTLFLDEIGNLSTSVQAKLLRVIQEREIERLGGKNRIPIDVRIISATNVDIRHDIRAGKFREDLYHRINEFSLDLPPLRERNGDLEALIRYFIEEFNKEYHKSVEGVSEDAMALFEKYTWPGNVRELRNCIRRAMIVCNGRIESKDVPTVIKNDSASAGDSGFSVENLSLDFNQKVPLKEVSRRVSAKIERQIIVRVLDEFGGNRGKAAEFLCIDNKTLYNKIKELGLDN